jgi:hypothetical protein
MYLPKDALVRSGLRVPVRSYHGRADRPFCEFCEFWQIFPFLGRRLHNHARCWEGVKLGNRRPMGLVQDAHVEFSLGCSLTPLRGSFGALEGNSIGLNSVQARAGVPSGTRVGSHLFSHITHSHTCTSYPTTATQ